MRFVFDLLGPPAFLWSLPPLTIDAITAAPSVLFAATQSNPLKLLAYGTNENIGALFIALGLAPAAAGAKGAPLAVETSVAFAVLIAFIVIGIFLFRIRERFDTVSQELERVRGGFQ